MYSKKVLDHFQNPRNRGQIKNPDGAGKVGNIICGDVMHLYIKIAKNRKNRPVIKDIKFKTLGCAAAIANSSIITELAKNKTIPKALKINKSTIIKSLGGLPPIKIHCSILAIDALAEAVHNYLSKSNQKIPPKLATIHQRIEKERELIKQKYKNWK
ncbi:iron-sulfur cluster assembly scaffold protein [Patescibacteria group bacterium]|nr:iron-sulfur cluster assembly scaffold protein [Patescibacteria group bacterium]